MKIIHIITGLNRGGAEQNLLNLLRNTDYSKFQPCVVSLTDEGEIGIFIKELNVPLYSLNINKSKFFIIKIFIYLISIFKLAFIIKKIKPQIVQTWLHHSDFIGLICCLIIRQKNLIWSIHCSYLNKEFISIKNIILVKILSLFSKFPKLIIFNSKAGYKAHKEIGYLPYRYKFIYSGTDTNKFKPDKKLSSFYREKYNINSNSKVIGYIGKYEKIKDIDTFLLTVEQIQQSIDDSCIIMAGSNLDFKNKILLNKLRRKNLKNFKLLGSIGNINEVILTFDILLLTSLSEGFPNVLIEAMASGVPCVSTKVGDVPAILDPGDIADVGDYKNLSKSSIKYLKLANQEKDNLITNIRSKIVQKYDGVYTSKQFENTYKDIVSNG